MAACAYLHLQPLGQGIYHRCTHAMEPAGNLIAPAAELSSGMKDGKYHLHRRDPGLFLDVHRDPAAVVHHRNGIIRVDLDVDGITVSRQGLIHGIVYDLIYKMMKSPGGSAPNIHSRSFSYCFKAFQDLNLVGSIFCAHDVPPLNSVTTAHTALHSQRFLQRS